MPGYKWVQRNSNQQMPFNAVLGGQDCDGSEIFIGRANHCGDVLPAKVIPAKRVAYVAHDGQEHAKYTYEVLVPCQFAWVNASHGSVPSNAVVGGRTSNGETLYVGRVWHNGSQTVGKVHRSHGCLYIPFGGREMSFKQYEVLVEN